MDERGLSGNRNGDRRGHAIPRLEDVDLRATPLADTKLSLEERIAWGMKHLGLRRGTAEQLIASMEGKPIDDVIRD